MVRSLNLAVRKKETERIELENHAFAKRLFDKVPNLSHNRFDEEYKAHLRFKKQIKKVDLPPVLPIVASEPKKSKKRSHTQHDRTKSLDAVAVFKNAE
jgi:hypothetical protein